VDLSWVSACTTSAWEATPLAYWFFVSSSACSKAATVASSSCFWASRVRS
jgi:hypothetical protein